MKGFVVAAPRSGSGKTLVTLGLLGALRAGGLHVAPAKTGPDYIDGAILRRAAGRPAINLDPWAMAPGRLAALATAHAADADLLVVEGVMGLFDGAADGTGSTGDLAAALGLPVLLVIDTERMSQSIAPLVMGFARWRDDVHVAGLILNRVASPRHEQMLRAALAPTGLPALGALPRLPALTLPERHLGLVLPDEVAQFDAVVRAAREAVEGQVDVGALTSLAGHSDAGPDPSHRVIPAKAGTQGQQSPAAASGPWVPAFAGMTPGEIAPSGLALQPLGQRIAVARDDAFAFIYPHWLADWRAAGAELSFFSPLADEAPDPTADAIFLPGGYPELHGARLAAASRFHAGLFAARDRGALIYGECGGFMVLGETLTDREGITDRMAGLLPVATRIDRPRRVLGYRRLTHASPLPFPAALRGHEFHYSSATHPPGKPLFEATDTLGEKLPPMGLVEGRVMGSYAHVIDVG